MLNTVKARALLETKGFTRKKLADECGISSRSLSRILCAKANPGRSVVKLMAISLGVTEKDLWLEPSPEDCPKAQAVR